MNIMLADLGTLSLLCAVVPSGPDSSPLYGSPFLSMATVGRARRARGLVIRSHNLRGLKSEAKLEELFHSMRTGKVFSASVQETWRSGAEELENSGLCAIFAGLKQ